MQAMTGTLSAAFHLTHNCNLRCTYCYTGDKFGLGMSRATADQAVRFCIAQARESGVDHLEVIFFGGEPLMKLDLLCQIVDQTRCQAEDLRTTFKLSTNGVLLTADAIDRLSRRGVFVSISLDGNPALQAQQRPGIHGRDVSMELEAAIDRLLQWNPCAAVNCVVTPESAGQLDESVRWIFARGFAYVSTALDYSAAWTREDLRALGAAYERLAEWYYQETIEGERFYLSCFDEKMRSWTRGPLEKSERCHIGTRQFSIAPSGRLYPCVQFVQEDRDDTFVIGNVFDGFHQQRKRSLVCESEAEHAECGGCALQQRCSSWCACVNWQSTGRLDEPSPIVCEHERVLMPIVDRLANRLWRRRDPNFIHKNYNPAFPVLSFAELLVIKEAARVEV